MKIIINADDFGKTQSINKAICYCFEKGFITNTTLMVNMPFADEAVRLAKENGFWDKVGIHLNLTEGIPLNKELQNSKLFCDENGVFKGTYQELLLSRFLLSKKLRREIDTEIELQLQKFLSYKPDYLHLDSHHHVHTDWSILRELKPLFIKYSFSSIRLSKNLNVTGSFINRILKNFYKNIYNAKLERITKKHTDLFCDFEDYLLLQNDFLKNKTFYDNKTLELMCHPDFIDEKLKNLWTGNGDAENFKKVSVFLKEHNLISYKDL